MNAWRLLPANLVWAVAFVIALVATVTWAPAVVLFAVVALPVAGLHRMAALLERGDPATFSDFLRAMRTHAVPAFALGLVAVVLAVLFTTNVIIGLQSGGLFGYSVSMLAVYADIGLAMFFVALWPILVDPHRQELTLGRRLRLALVVNLARPGRMLVLTALVGFFLVASMVVFAALLTVTAAFAALLATRYVLPAVDRLEGRATRVELYPPENGEPEGIPS